MSEIFLKPESGEDVLKRLEEERTDLRQTYINLLWSAEQNTPEDAKKATEFFNECLEAIHELIDHEVQPGFDKEEDLGSARKFYLNIIDMHGNEFIRKRKLKMNTAQMKIVCDYYYDHKILMSRIQGLISNDEALKRAEEKRG